MSQLLRYSIALKPFPVQASATNGQISIIDSLNVIAANESSDNVTITGIIVSIPVGNGPGQLTNNAAAMSMISPDGWNMLIKHPAGFADYVFTPKNGTIILTPQSLLQFIFVGIPVNSSPGPLFINVTEGSNGCTPPGCPVIPLPVTKFPNGWGDVIFTALPADISLGDTVTLAWSGPAGATYAIEYYDAGSGQVINIPAPGTLPLGSSGTFQGILPIETTTFTMLVSETIDEKSYAAQVQQIVTLEIPKILEVIGFTTSSDSMGVGQNITLTWETELADQCCLSLTGVTGSIEVGAANDTLVECILSSTDGLNLIVTRPDGTALGEITLPAPQIPVIQLVLTASNTKSNAQKSLNINLLPANFVSLVPSNWQSVGPISEFTLTWNIQYMTNLYISTYNTDLNTPLSSSSLNLLTSSTGCQLTAQGFLGPVTQIVKPPSSFV